MWKDIIGFEGYYQINEHGEVRSVDRYMDNNGTQILKKGQLIKPYIDTNGYYQVNFSVNGKKTKGSVHRLVAIHFLENPNKLNEVNHIDHDKLNCHVSNLEWVTRKENQEKMVLFYGKRETRKCIACDSTFTAQKSEPKLYCSVECVRMNRQHLRKVERPSKDDLLELLKSNSFVKVGLMFGVSDNAIRKWCKDYGLPFKKKDIDKLK